jgi:hypothetical protein
VIRDMSIEWKSRAHVFALAAQTIRRIQLAGFLAPVARDRLAALEKLRS